MMIKKIFNNFYKFINLVLIFVFLFVCFSNNSNFFAEIENSSIDFSKENCEKEDVSDLEIAMLEKFLFLSKNRNKFFEYDNSSANIVYNSLLNPPPNFIL